MKARRPQLRRAPVVVAVAAVAAFLAGCGSDDDSPTTTASDEPATSSAAAEASPTTPDAPASSEAPASPLEGTWRAGPISLKASEATVRRYGLGKWVEEYRRNAPYSGDTVLTLTIQDGAWDLYGETDGGPPQPIDYNADYEIDGSSVVFHHSEGSNTYDWKVDGDTLSLEFAKSTLPGYQGIPEEVFQRALYMTQDFKKQS